MIKRLTLLALTLTLPIAAFADPVWIWTSKHAGETEKATFKTTFDVSGEVKSAVLKVTCDNGSTSFINDKEVAQTPDWQFPAKVDVKKFLKAGANEIVIHAENRGAAAALVAVLNIELADGKKIAVETNEKWQFTPEGKQEWKPAVFIAKYGEGPWGDAFNSTGKAAKVTKGGAAKNKSGAVTPPDEIIALPGFKVELLYTVPQKEQGSWVSMTVDKKGRILCGDQYGGIYRLTPPPVGSGDKAVIEAIDAPHIGGAHGILYAHDSLYFMLNEVGAPQAKGMKPGLYRAKDKDGDDHFEEPVLLSECPGGGEHGPHSPVLGPDGKSIFFNAGNHTKTALNLTTSRAVMNSWDEDHILPRMWDANGHARGIMAPGGCIYKTDADGKKIELFCSGFRNEFDFAFDANGEMFTYDADMEWDMGSPWYRPTRINHCVSGGEYGWRSGTGKWPAYYEDSLPAVMDIGPGSPTGVVFGTGAKFPAKYQRAFFGNDWTYGTMYAIHFEPSGASFKAVKEEFVSGKALPLTDVVINPQDGAMYFAIGGRRTQSAVYRVTYEGKENTEKAKPYALTKEIKERHELEKLHAEEVESGAVAKILKALGSKDRNIRFAARVALERRPLMHWADLVGQGDPQTVIEGEIAYARMIRHGENERLPTVQPDKKPSAGSSSAAVAPMPEANGLAMENILERLGRLDFNTLNLDLQLQLVRAYQLAFTRLGKPDAATLAKVAAHLDPVYPSKDQSLNRELCQLLIFLESKSVVAKTLNLVATARDDDPALASDELLARNAGYARAADEVHVSRPNRQQIALMFSLRCATAGWTPELRHTYFSWFPHARTWKGGNSFKGFIENARKEALAGFVPESERAELDALSSKNEVVTGAVAFVAPKGPGKAYTIDDVLELAKGGLKGRSFEQGKSMFTSTLCSSCHHFAGDGGNVGPDITGAGNRYSLHDLMENIIDPSKVISDQYDSSQIEKKDGGLIIGRIISTENGKLMVMTNPFAPTDLVGVNESDVKSKKTYPISMMPPGLINALNKDELLDLVAYLLSGGNPKDKAFAQ